MQNSPTRSSVDVGSVIAGTYTIEALIGRGGMGAVFLASHTRLPGKKVAIKVLHAEMTSDEVLARFKREAQIASLLSHPNIVHIEDYNVTADGMPYLVLEYLQGESLAQRLRRGPLPVDQVFSIIRQVGSALAAAHAKGIVHRDLKPQNIFLVPTEIDGRPMEIAKVLDFGISKMRDSQTVQTQDNALLGTPQYMAPEQATGQHDRVNERTDIFALGAIVYEMLSGHPAFSGQTIPEVVFKVVYEQPAALETRVPALSDTVRDAVQRALSKPAEERFDSVNSFISALTGTPVSLSRIRVPTGPESGFASGSAATGTVPAPLDVFARTMASGEHGLSPLSSTLPSSTPPVLGDAPTVASQAGVVATPAPASRRGLVIGGAVVAAAAIAGIVLLTKRSEAPAASHEPAGAPQVAVVAPPAVPPTPPTPVVVPADAAEPVTAPTDAAVETPKATSDAGVAATPPTRPSPPPKPPTNEVVDDDGPPDGQPAKKLREAHQAVAAKNWQAAEQAANAVLTAEDARPKQRALATLVHGTVQCVFRNNEDAAGADLRSLVRFAALHDQLLDRCQEAGYLMGKTRLKRR